MDQLNKPITDNFIKSLPNLNLQEVTFVNKLDDLDSEPIP